MTIIAIFIVSLLTAVAAVGVVKKAAIHFKIGAFPSSRKMHTDFKPILGGLGIFVALMAGVGAANLFHLLPLDILLAHNYFWMGLAVILMTGFVDDVWGVHHLKKFGGQLLAALLAVKGGVYIDAFYSPLGGALPLGSFSYAFTVLWIIFIINAVNLLDGLDGLAGGISLITATGFLIISIYFQKIFWIILAISLIGSLLGFLKHNYHPASIFMGDVGSLMLGYILACFSIETLKIANSQQVYFLASLVLLGMPLTDTLISFFRRMGRGDHPFKPDREHIHHRLIKLGVSHLDSVWMMYYFTFLFVALGVLMVIYLELAGVLLFVMGFCFAVFWAWRLGYVETRHSISFGVQEQVTPASIRPPIHIEQIWHKIAILFGDIFSINLAMYFTLWFRFRSGIIEPEIIKAPLEYFNEPVWLVLTGVWLLMFWLNGLFRMPWDVSRFDKTIKVCKIISFGLFVFLLLLNLDLFMGTREGILFNKNQMWTLGVYWVSMMILVNGIRLLIIKIEKRFLLFEYTLKNTLVIGATRKAKTIIRDIQSNPHFLNNVTGIVANKYKEKTFAGYPILGNYHDLPGLIQQHNIEEIIIAINETNKDDLLNIIGICDRFQVVVKTLPGLQAYITGKSHGFNGYGLVRVFPNNMVLWQWVVKRLVDMIFAASVLILTFPAWVILAIVIKIQFVKGTIVKIPILGKNGRVFNMYLFRIGKANQLSYTIYHLGDKNHNLTPLGKMLYKTQIYKFPLLVNIFKGDMSLVGPRPESLEWYRDNHHRFQFLHRRLIVRPGITGMAQFRYRFDESQKMLKERLKYDVFYSENISLNLDIRIIIRSVLLLFKDFLKFEAK